MKQTIIVVDGPDNTGKTSLLQKLVTIGCARLIEFPKTLDGQTPFKIESDQEIAIFETMLQYLDTDETYILDRSYLSNYVYESIRSGKPKTKYLNDFKRLSKQHNILLIPLLTNVRLEDYSDDLITLSKNQYNATIDLYKKAYEYLDETIHQNLKGGLELIRKDGDKFKMNEDSYKAIIEAVDNFKTKTRRNKNI